MSLKTNDGVHLEPEADINYHYAIGVRQDNNKDLQLDKYTRTSASDLYYEDANGVPLNHYMPIDQDVHEASATENGADYMYDTVRDMGLHQRHPVMPAARASYLVLYDDKYMPLAAD